MGVHLFNSFETYLCETVDFLVRINGDQYRSGVSLWLLLRGGGVKEYFRAEIRFA